MVRGSLSLLKCATTGAGLNATLTDMLVCPLSKQPLRLCRETNSLISDSVGVSYPIVNGIPRLVPADGKVIAEDDGFSSQDAKALPEINSSAEKDYYKESRCKKS
ncbi:uncharacterized protein LOC127240150 [Andrographis paniculata]|uniref:uncharacterized protein LOC127240150 n=1 Tax=Andrographis paniculata TaxID=175694 RepID=UPI0021E83806|nr:uncharacterized protein LOC127240150 [Andrographis paniculata]